MSSKKITYSDIPLEVQKISQDIKKAGFKAYLIGGCTRDILILRKPKDWDITTDATPKEIMEIFGDRSFYENKFGTVGIVQPVSEKNIVDESVKVVEVTTFRIDAQYSDQRRPDNVVFSKNILEDIKRRDFTINAIAIEFNGEPENFTYEVIDPHGGLKDIKDKLLRTVGNPHERFGEDALRILRGVRLLCELDLKIDLETKKAMEFHVKNLANISRERIRDEFTRIVMSEKAYIGMHLCREIGILAYISDDLNKSFGINQNKAHKYDVFEHLLKCLEHSSKKNYPIEIRLAALFHDIGKPKSRRWSDKKGDWTFHGHEVVGERITREILEDLKFPGKIIDEVCKLVRWHMFFSDTEQITLSAVRRMVANVGRESIWKLMDVRMCDRMGTGRPKENPYRLRKYKSMIEQVMTDPVSVSMLNINGLEIMNLGKIESGPKIGHILHALLDEVIEEPKKNDKKFLVKRALELSKLSDSDLETIGLQAKEKKELEESDKISQIRKKYFVE